MSTFSYDLNEARMDSVFIGISGLIGAGKSTLAAALAKRLNLPVYYEPVKDNVYLADFYKDMKKHAFAMQVYLLNARFKQQQQIVWSGKGGVQDRTIYEDSVFARMLRNAGLMDARDYATYISLFNHMSNFMKRPNIIVHLDVPPEESLRRIAMRDRDCESGITLEYLQGLYAAYEDFIRDISRVIPVIRVDYSSFRDVEEMADRISSEYGRIHNIRHVEFSDGSGASGSPTPGPRVVEGSLSPKVVAGDIAAAGAAVEGESGISGSSGGVAKSLEFGASSGSAAGSAAADAGADTGPGKAALPAPTPLATAAAASPGTASVSSSPAAKLPDGADYPSPGDKKAAPSAPMVR